MPTRKTRFFDALARDYGTKSLRRISVSSGISESCGRKWKDQWLKMGSIVRQKTRSSSKVLGYKSRVTKEICKIFVLPSRNPFRIQLYEAQIEHFKIPVKKC
ncbi:hypothetical protein CJF30_00004641 [Rutstroemia sp. NJR-2017a BBW]|nr:hypothetical protein CJF30_00004641 [Rutstroemia sp. NJR-2017a BBW]